MTDSPVKPSATSKQIAVKMKDGQNDFADVRQLPVTEYEAYLSCIKSEREQLALLCGKPLGWVDQLSAGSFNELMTMGDQLNLDLFGDWFRRKQDRIEKMQMGSTKFLQERIGQVVGALPHAEMERILSQASPLNLADAFSLLIAEIDGVNAATQRLAAEVRQPSCNPSALAAPLEELERCAGGAKRGITLMLAAMQQALNTPDIQIQTGDDLTAVADG